MKSRLPQNDNQHHYPYCECAYVVVDKGKLRHEAASPVQIQRLRQVRQEGISLESYSYDVCLNPETLDQFLGEREAQLPPPQVLAKW